MAGVLQTFHGSLKNCSPITLASREPVNHSNGGRREREREREREDKKIKDRSLIYSHRHPVKNISLLLACSVCVLNNIIYETLDRRIFASSSSSSFFPCHYEIPFIRHTLHVTRICLMIKQINIYSPTHGVVLLRRD